MKGAGVRGVRGAAVALAAVALAECLDVSATVSVAADATASGTYENLGSADEGSSMGIAEGSLQMTVTMPGRIDVVDGFEQLDGDTVR